MECEKIYGFKNQIDNEGLMFCYSGVISQGVVEEIGEALRYKMEVQSGNSRIIQRVFSIFIEQVQNIMKYSAEKNMLSDEELKSGIVIIGEKNKKFFIESGNLVKNKEKNKLKEKLEKIKNMDKEELKEFYKQQIQKKNSCNSQSAGLGFIQIARRASEPIEYKIEDVDKGHSFFSLKVVI